MKIFAALILAQFWMFPELLTINFANALTIIADLLCPKVVIPGNMVLSFMFKKTRFRSGSEVT